MRRQSWASRFGMVAIGFLECGVLLWTARHFGLADRRFVPYTAAYLWAGLLVTVAGLAFAIWARITLGRNWSGIVTVKQDHQLIRTGPYRLVRHPIYTGMLVAACGTALFYGTVGTVPVIVAALLVCLQKIKLEEQFMAEQFATEYSSYRRTTKMLVPFVW